MFSSIFVDRPRLAIVIAIIITIAGGLALRSIPLSQFPDIVPPQVQVTANYPGASAAVVEQAVAQPIEAQMVGVDKSIYMKSVSGNDGSYTLTVSFELGTNPDIDTVNVNNRVQTAQSQLPAQVTLQGLTIPQALVRRAAVHDAVFGQRQAGPAIHHELRRHQRARRDLAHARRRPGAVVRQAQLFDADLVRHREADEPQSCALRHHQCDPGAEQPGGDRPDRRRARSAEPAVPAEPPDRGAPDNRRAIRRHRAARQRGRVQPQDQGRRQGRTGRAEPGHRELAVRQAGRRDRHLSVARRQCRFRPPPPSMRRWPS